MALPAGRLAGGLFCCTDERIGQAPESDGLARCCRVQPPGLRPTLGGARRPVEPQAEGDPCRPPPRHLVLGANAFVGTAFADRLVGGLGNDLLTGGGGADRFVFDSVPNAGSNVDTLADFVPGTDDIVLDLAVFKGFAAPGALAAGQFYSASGATAAHDADDRIVYNTKTGALYYDADGLGGAAAVQIALIGSRTHPADLSAIDFDIVAGTF